MATVLKPSPRGSDADRRIAARIGPVPTVAPATARDGRKAARGTAFRPLADRAPRGFSSAQQILYHLTG